MVLSVAAILATGCNPKHQSAFPPSSRSHKSGSSTAAAPEAVGGSCHARPGQVPDAGCTPGATNPQVTQANIKSTICKSGWTATIRPPVSVTDKLKREGIGAYGYTDKSMRSYEEDHLISLAIDESVRTGHTVPVAAEPWAACGR